MTAGAITDFIQIRDAKTYSPVLNETLSTEEAQIIIDFLCTA